MKEIKIKKFTFNDFQENTYVLSHNNGDTLIFDPGCNTTKEEEALFSYIEKNNLKISHIINTHCHIDHILGNAACVSKFQKPLWIPKAELALLEAGTVIADRYGIPYDPSPAPDHLMTIQSELKLGSYTIEIRSVPGHSPDSLAFYIAEEKMAIVGDVLFLNSIGRTDLPGGNHQQLLKSIKEKLYSLPEDTVVYPGHGPETQIGYEKRSNPFVQA